MNKDELIYYLAFSYCFGIGPMTFQSIKKHPKGIKGIYEASEKELLSVFEVKLTERFIKFRNKFNPIEELDKLKKEAVTVLPVDSEEYPESLKHISDPPICLYVKGDANLLANGKVRPPKNLSQVGPPPSAVSQVENFFVASPSQSSQKQKSSFDPTFFAIVGTRKPTPYGIQVAKKFAYELAGEGFVIISGMAMGIDTIAHQAALDAGGKTVAILGCGVNIIYPSVNRNLYENIIKSGGAVISEFPPNQFVLKGLFIARNRIISGLSKGVLIVEGLQDSGALITARFAGEQGKEIFAPPGPITSEMSSAPNFLLKQGAKPVTSVKDIYEEFNMEISPRKKEDIKAKLNEIEKFIYDILEKNPQTVDDLAANLRKPVTDILNIMSVMEIGGIIEKNQENKYQIRL